MDYNIPDKLTFKRKEVVNLTKLDGKVIDYWEKEFGGLKPVVNQMGEKFYSRKDVEMILKIKQLLIVEKKEKSEVKEIIKNEMTDVFVEKQDFKRNEKNKKRLSTIKSSLKEILTILDKNDKK